MSPFHALSVIATSSGNRQHCRERTQSKQSQNALPMNVTATKKRLQSALRRLANPTASPRRRASPISLLRMTETYRYSR